MAAFTKSLYRLLISHKNLLNWVTAEEVAKSAHNNLGSYIKNFWFNILTSLAFIGITYLTRNYIALLIAIIFISAPFVLYLVSKDIDHREVELKDKKIEEIEDIAYKTWKYFEDNIREEYNYLIPDNYQENREERLDIRTSPTAIGYSLTSVISAFQLGFIELDKAVFLLKNILKDKI